MTKMKREIDKDLMYQKLMPSNLKGTHQTNQAANIQEREAPSAMTISELIQEKPSSPLTVARRDGTLPLIDNQPAVLVNLTENMVLEKFEAVLAEFRCCKCDRCKKDIFALALNKLPPRYVVIPQESPGLPNMDSQFSAQVLTALIQSVLQVRRNPRH